MFAQSRIVFIQSMEKKSSIGYYKKKKTKNKQTTNELGETVFIKSCELSLKNCYITLPYIVKLEQIPNISSYNVALPYQEVMNVVRELGGIMTRLSCTVQYHE